jgi:hypothetical protein
MVGYRQASPKDPIRRKFGFLGDGIVVSIRAPDNFLD